MHPLLAKVLQSESEVSVRFYFAVVCGLYALNGIVCQWTASLPAGSAAIWPDGCRDVIAITSQAGIHVICSSLDVGVRTITCRETTQFVGWRLAPGVLLAHEHRGDDYLIRDAELTPSQLSLHGDAPFSELSVQQLQSVLVDHLRLPPAWLSDYFCELTPTHSPIRNRLSERHIRRQVTALTGASPNYWRRLKRARQVAKSLASSDEPIAALAFDHGYSDQAHLTREMQHWFRCSPLKLRREHEQTLQRLAGKNAFSPWSDSALA